MMVFPCVKIGPPPQMMVLPTCLVRQIDCFAKTHVHFFLESPWPFQNGSMSPLFWEMTTIFKGPWRLQVRVSFFEGVGPYSTPKHISLVPNHLVVAHMSTSSKPKSLCPRRGAAALAAVMASLMGSKSAASRSKRGCLERWYKSGATWATFHFQSFWRYFNLENFRKPKDLVNRTMVEKNGESTPRTRAGILPQTMTPNASRYVYCIQ